MFNKRKSKYEFIICDVFSDSTEKYLDKLQGDGWELAGNCSIRVGKYRGDEILHVPLKRKLK